MQTIKEAIDALPDTHEKIAEYLRENKHKGLIGSTTLCPLATYFKEKTGEIVSVSCGQVLTEYPGPIYFLPRAAIKFYEDFDSGLYPELHKNTTI